MDAFIAEIRPFALSYTPEGWLLCNGQTLPIALFQPLYALIGTRYGGNGTTEFKLPNIQGTALVGAGQLPGGDRYDVGVKGGTPGVALVDSQMPVHTHLFNGLTTSDSAPAKGISVPTAASYVSNVFGVPPYVMKRQGNFYSDASPNAVLNSQAMGAFPGQSQAHDNMQPYLVINYCICYEGYWPVQP